MKLITLYCLASVMKRAKVTRKSNKFSTVNPWLLLCWHLFCFKCEKWIHVQKFHQLSLDTCITHCVKRPIIVPSIGEDSPYCNDSFTQKNSIQYCCSYSWRNELVVGKLDSFIFFLKSYRNWNLYANHRVNTARFILFPWTWKSSWILLAGEKFSIFKYSIDGIDISSVHVRAHECVYFGIFLFRFEKEEKTLAANKNSIAFPSIDRQQYFRFMTDESNCLRNERCMK